MSGAYGKPKTAGTTQSRSIAGRAASGTNVCYNFNTKKINFSKATLTYQYIFRKQVDSPRWQPTVTLYS